MTYAGLKTKLASFLQSENSIFWPVTFNRSIWDLIMKDNGSIVTHHYEGSVPFFSWPFTIQWPLFPLLLIHRGIFVSSQWAARNTSACNNVQEEVLVTFIMMLQSQVQANLINQRIGKLFQRVLEGKKGLGNRVVGIHLPTAGFSGFHTKFVEIEWITNVLSSCLIT